MDSNLVLADDILAVFDQYATGLITKDECIGKMVFLASTLVDKERG